MYAKINWSKGNKLFITLMSEGNHKKIFTSEEYDDADAVLNAIQLAEEGIDRVVLDDSVTKQFQTIRDYAERMKPPVELEKHPFMGDGDLCAECGTNNVSVHTVGF